MYNVHVNIKGLGLVKLPLWLYSQSYHFNWKHFR